ncbi:hypothetical protein ACFVKC_20100 [Streptomyces noursei]|uniref:hypothetical protein n=1 Tax=Streptomyces noursei TaxID=1971 RepID=UPI00362CA663
MKAAVAEMEPFRRVVTPATRQRIRSTLRAALNTAIAQQLITFNPAAHVALEAGKRPKALVWTEERVLHWQRTGEKPSPVMVWKPEHTGLFLDHVSEDRLYALWHLIAFRGLRRGEACGQRWTDTHLADGRITVAKQLVVSGWEVYEDDPKTDAGARTIALDSGTIRALERHRPSRTRTARRGAAPGWRPGASSPGRTASCSTPPTSPCGSPSCARRPASRRSGSTTCATEPRPSPTRPGPT